MTKPKRKGDVTSVDVARAAGVSQSVVSRAFSSAIHVAPATRDRIFEVARRIGYRQNELARSLITNRSRLLALVSGEPLSLPLHLEMVEAFMRAAQARDHRVLLVSATEGRSTDAAVLDVLSYRPAGVLVLAGTPGQETVDECTESGVPIALMGRDGGGTSASWIACDNALEGARIARMLIGAGHRRLAFVASRNATTAFGAARGRGFCDTVVAQGLEAPVVVDGNSTYVGGYAAARTLFAGGNRPDAVFCANDEIAMGLIDGIRREPGLRIPDDVSVIGFDDAPMAAWASYELTSVRQRVPEMASQAVEILMRRAGVDDAPVETIRVPADLVLRKSARLD